MLVKHLLVLMLFGSMLGHASAQSEGSWSEFSFEGVSVSKDVGLISSADHTISFQSHTPLRFIYAISMQEKSAFYWTYSASYINRLYEVDDEDGGEGLTFKGGEATGGLGYVLLGTRANTDRVARLDVELSLSMRVGKVKGYYSSFYFFDNSLSQFRSTFDGPYFEVGPMFRIRGAVDITHRFGLTLASRLRVVRRFASNAISDSSVQVGDGIESPKPEDWNIDHELLTLGVCWRI